MPRDAPVTKAFFPSRRPMTAPPKFGTKAGVRRRCNSHTGLLDKKRGEPSLRDSPHTLIRCCAYALLGTAASAVFRALFERLLAQTNRFIEVRIELSDCAGLRLAQLLIEGLEERRLL